MRILGIDIETSGLDFDKDHIIQIGWVLRDTEVQPPLMQQSVYISDPDYPEKFSDEVFAVHGISPETCNKFGVTFHAALAAIRHAIIDHKVDALCAHNGTGFDKPFLLAKSAPWGDICKTFAESVWIDTRTDIDYPSDCKSNSLMYLAAYHGFINPFPHDAISDVNTMLRILWQYDIEKVVEKAKEPWFHCYAKLTFDTKDQAKSRGYRWNGEKKVWEKSFRQSDYKKEIEEVPFDLKVYA